MAPLLTTAELAGYLRAGENTEGLEAALLTAEALVAAHIGAIAGLAEVAHEATLYPARASKFLDLEAGPMITLTAITVNGVALTAADYRPTPWYVQARGSVFAGFAEGDEVAIAYTTGWTAENLPAGIRQALLMTAAACFNRPDGTVSRTGFSEDVTFFRAERIPVDVPPLLAPWRRLNV